MTGASVLHDAVTYTVFFLQRYGWYLIFTLVAFYFIRPYLIEYSRKASLQRANNPHRKAVLEEEVKRARVRQQLDIYKANRECRA
mmetsp:Transcript_26443/g.26694  ORF Transcript_26443/g.26694 Transcript_26443/m.26694 type:complete len:85 (+) Transcript_26443:110-364(+)